MSEPQPRGHGRIFFVMYDISGADQKSVVSDILADWHRLTNVEHITDSPSYLRHRAKPLLGIWGLGFKDRPLGPDQASQLIKALQSGDGSPAVTVLGGVPAGWRTLTADSRSETQWSEVYRSLDVISPWSVGRFGDDRGAEAFMRERMVPDVAETSLLNIDYMPVIFPGFSWHNLKGGAINQISRKCGRFYQAQASNALMPGRRCYTARCLTRLMKEPRYSRYCRGIKTCRRGQLFWRSMLTAAHWKATITSKWLDAYRGTFTVQAAKDLPSRGQCFADPLQLWLVVSQILELSSA